MAGRSFIFSSERQFPSAFVSAISLLVAFEIALRFSGWPRVLPYELGRMEYAVAAEAIDRDGAAEISIVGSSRARESVVVPLLSERLSGKAGRAVRVANYACSRACTPDFEAVVRRLLRAPVRPRMILVGISDRDLVSVGKLWDELPVFESLADLREGFPERGAEVVEDLPVITRHSIGQIWRTLGLRDFMRLRLVQSATGQARPSEASPAQGGLTEWQRSSPSRNLRKSPVTQSLVLNRAAAMTLDDMPDPQLADALDDLARDCHDAGVPLVFYEVGRSAALRAALPREVYAKFDSLVRDAAMRNGARYLTLDALGLKLGDADMREPSHMNYRGAKSLTQALCGAL